MKNSISQEQYKVSEGNNQLVLILNSEILLPEDAPVRVTSAQLEELDYRKLYEAYSSRGRKSVAAPRVMFKVMAYGYQCGIPWFPKPVLCIFSDAEGLVLVSDLHQTHAANDNQCCQKIYRLIKYVVIKFRSGIAPGRYC